MAMDEHKIVYINFWEQSPANLRTYTQLRHAHLKPHDRQQADAWLWCHDEWWPLYDQQQALPRRRMTAKQRDAQAAAWVRTQAKYTCRFCGDAPTHLVDLKRLSPGVCRECQERLAYYAARAADRAEVCLLAQRILAHPEQAAVLDTETTSLYGEPVEIAAVGLDGQTLFYALMKPTFPITSDARARHHIEDAELENAPALVDIWATLQQALAGKTILLAYNAPFDAGILNGTARRDGLTELSQQWICLMDMYATFCGAWSETHQSYQWQPLNGGHRALGDALAALAVLKAIAQPDEHERTPEELLLAELGQR
jgi:DNA polymerase-3 subunit epsilon